MKKQSMGIAGCVAMAALLLAGCSNDNSGNDGGDLEPVATAEDEQENTDPRKG